MQLFYSEKISEEIELSKDESRHLIKVLRKNYGDEIFFTDGIGGKYLCKITDDNPKRTCLQVIQKEIIKRTSPKLTIAIAPTKNMDRLEWFLEKSTEIGVYRIIPFISSHSERKMIKKERLEKIIISAMKQSLKFYKPILEDLISFNHLMSISYQSTKFLAHLDKKHPKLFQDTYGVNNDLLIVIGPEGDFNDSEINLALDNGFSLVSLGSSRLRTETAGVVACHSFNFMNKN